MTPGVEKSCFYGYDGECRAVENGLWRLHKSEGKMTADSEGQRRTSRIRTWSREVERWNFNEMTIESQKMILVRLNHLYSQSVESVNPDVVAELFGDTSDALLLGAWYLGDVAASVRLLAKIRSRPRT